MALTGRFEFRKTLLGKLVLLVEEDAATSFSGHGSPEPMSTHPLARRS